MNKHKKNRGFSLIEVLVALTILAALMLMVTQGLRTAAQSTARAEALGDHAQSVMTTRRVLGEWFRHAQALPLEEDNVSFEGGPQSASFTTLAPAYPTERGFYTIHLRADLTQEGDYALQIVRTPLVEKFEDQKGQAILMRSSTPFAFRYRRHNTERNNRQSTLSQWREAWPSRGMLPGFMKLSYSDPSGVGQSLIFPIASMVAPSCLTFQSDRSFKIAEACQ